MNDEANMYRYSDLRRFGLGLATCLSAAYTAVTMPEMTGGELNKNNWLGMPISDIKYPAKSTPDLLNNGGVVMNAGFVRQFKFGNAHSKVINNELHIKGPGPDIYKNLAFFGPEVNITDGDLVIFLEAKAIEGLVDFEASDRVPRKVYAKLESPAGETIDSQFGFIGTAGFTPLCFYFRNAGKGKNSLRIKIEIEEQGEIALRNFSIHNSPLVMVREFKKGVVLVNASTDLVNFDLGKALPGKTKLKHLDVHTPKYEFYDEREKEYHLLFNNGQKVKNLKEVEVPGLNALFLLK